MYRVSVCVCICVHVCPRNYLLLIEFVINSPQGSKFCRQAAQMSGFPDWRITVLLIHATYYAFIGFPPGCVYVVTHGNRCGATKALAHGWQSRQSSWFSSLRGYTTLCECTHVPEKPDQHSRDSLISFNFSLLILMFVTTALFFFKSTPSVPFSDCVRPCLMML